MTRHRHVRLTRPIANTALILGMLLAIAVPTLRADDEEDGDEKEARFVLGQVVSVGDGKMVVKHVEGKGPETTLYFTPKDFKPQFVGFKGIGKPTDKVEAGQFIKTGLTKDFVIKGGLFSPAFPPQREIENKHKLSVEELFKKADENHDGKVDYLEYATWIFQSVKHLPDKFQHHLDTNGDDTLDIKEFEGGLELLVWFRISRKSPEQWIASEDKDKNGELDPQEIKPLLVVGHGGDPEAKRKKLFEKLDRDKSGGVNAKEFEPAYQSLVTRRN